MNLSNRTFEPKGKTDKYTSEVLKNATSVIFFKNQTHHKHTDDFKESKFSIINQFSENSPNSVNSQYIRANENQIISKFSYEGGRSDISDIRTPNHIEFEGTGFYGDNALNLEEYKSFCVNMEEFIGIMYNHLLTDLIPSQNLKLNRSSSLHNNSMSIERTVKAAKKLGKEEKSVIIISQTKKRLDMIFNLGFYRLDSLFKGKDYRAEIACFMNLQVKVLMSMWIVLEMVEDEKEIVHLLADIFTELFQCGLAITKLLLKKIRNEHKANEIYERLDKSVLYLITPPKENQEADYFNSINKLISNMLGIFIMNINQKVSQSQSSATEYLSTYHLIKLANNNYYTGLLIDLYKNLGNKSDSYINQLLSVLKDDEIGGSQLRNKDIMIKPKVPFLPPLRKNIDRNYTLVLDLDETLIHYSGKVSVIKVIYARN